MTLEEYIRELADTMNEKWAEFFYDHGLTPEEARWAFEQLEKALKGS